MTRIEEANKDVVRALVAAVNNRDIDAVLSLLSDDFQWFVAGRPDCFPLGGIYYKNQISEFLGKFLNTLKEYEHSIDHIFAEGDSVAQESHLEAEALDGRVYRNNFSITYRVRDGKILRLREYCDFFEVLNYMNAKRPNIDSK